MGSSRQSKKVLVCLHEMTFKCLLGMTSPLFELLEIVVIAMMDDQIELDWKDEHKLDDSHHMEIIQSIVVPYLVDQFDLMHTLVNESDCKIVLLMFVEDNCLRLGQHIRRYQSE